MRQYLFAEVGQATVEKVFLQMHAFLQKAGEPYFLIGGTLLGLVREGHLLHHDKDIDIGILDEASLYRLYDKLAAENYFDDLGFPGGIKNGKIMWAKKLVEPNKVVCFEIQAHYRYNDVVYYNRSMGVSWPWREGRCEWDKRFFEKLGTVEAYGRQWSTPGHVAKFLETFYGPDWKNEKQYHDWRYNTKNLKQGYYDMKRTIMIAGATRGIGEAIGNHFIDAGWNVSVCGRTMKDGEVGESILQTRCDLTNEAQALWWIKRTEEKFKYIDVLVFSAGRFVIKDFCDSSVSEFDELYQLTMRGYMATLKGVLPIMARQRDGYIINIGSTRSVTSALAKVMYSAVKRGAHAITDTVNIEFNGRGVQATNANFGVVHTQSSIDQYGKKFCELQPGPIGLDDVVKTIDYLVNLSDVARPKSITIGGRL